MKYDPVFNIELYRAMGVPFSDDPSNPWPTEEDYCDWYVKPTGMTWSQMVEEFQENGWWDCKAMPEEWKSTWGFYRRYQLGMLRPDGKPGMQTPTGKLELWSTVMETFYPEESDILPDYREAPLSRTERPDLEDEYPLICNTGRRIPVYFHSEHRQLPWIAAGNVTRAWRSFSYLHTLSFFFSYLLYLLFFIFAALLPSFYSVCFVAAVRA